MDAIQLFQLFLGLALFITVIFLTVKRKFSTSFSLLWIVISILAVLQGIFPGVLNTVCKWLGVQNPPTLVIVLAICCLIAALVYITSELAVAQNKIRELSIHISLLNDEMQRVKQHYTEEDIGQDTEWTEY